MTTETPAPIDVPLAGLANVPHVEELFGAWAILPDSFMASVRMLARADLFAHLSAQPSAAVQAAASDISPRTTGDGIAIVELHGSLTKHVSSFSPGGSTVLARRRIRAALDDPRVSGILLHIDSPGGTVAGTKELADDVAAAAKRKPVHAYIEDLGASAAYWIASQANRVLTNATGLVGSIGTYGVLYDLSEKAAQEGVRVHVVKAGEHKGAGIPGTPITDAHLAEAQRVVDSLNSHFLAAVAKGRGLTSEAVAKLADGRVHVGESAQAFRLVDGVTTFDATLAGLTAEAHRVPAVQSQTSSPAPRTYLEHLSDLELYNEAVRVRVEAGRSRRDVVADLAKRYPALCEAAIAEATAKAAERTAARRR